jgi:putative phage-type endonuclease
MTIETPTGILVPRLEPGSPEWLSRMSASKIAAVVGLSRFQSRFSLWHEMAGLLEPSPQSAVMSRGHYLEPAIAAWFADQHPDWTISETGTFKNPDRDWQIATPDRLVTHPNGHVELLQCKSAADHRDEWGADGSGQIPVGYRAQVTWEMDTVGVSTCHVAVIHAYLEFRSYIIEYDPVYADFLRDEAMLFLRDLADRRPPAIDAHKATYEAVRQLNPDILPEMVEVPDGIAELWLEAVMTERDAKGQRRFAAAMLSDHMGSAQDAYWRGRCIAQRRTKNGETPYLCVARGAFKESAA